MVVLDSVPDETVRRAVQTHRAGEDVTVHVVAPATNTSVLQWLTGAEDEAREEAEELATKAAEAVDADVETEVGDRDPLLAVQDALSTFPADEIVLAGRADPDTEAALREFGLPVSRVDGSAAAAGDAGEPLAHDIARGGSTRTPFVLLGLVGAFLIGVVALVSLIALLVYWLV